MASESLISCNCSGVPLGCLLDGQSQSRHVNGVRRQEDGTLRSRYSAEVYLALRLLPLGGELRRGVQAYLRHVRQRSAPGELQRVFALGDRKLEMCSRAVIEKSFPLRISAVGSRLCRCYIGRGGERYAGAEFPQVSAVEGNVYRPRVGGRVTDVKCVLAGNGEIDVVFNHRLLGGSRSATDHRAGIGKLVGARVDLRIAAIECPGGYRQRTGALGLADSLQRRRQDRDFRESLTIRGRDTLDIPHRVFWRLPVGGKLHIRIQPQGHQMGQRATAGKLHRVLTLWQRIFA